MATTTRQRRNSNVKPGLNITNDDALRVLVNRHKELKAIERAAAEAERERRKIEAELRTAMGDEEQIVVRGVVVAKLSSERHTVKIDRDTLETLFPEAAAATITKVPYRFVQVL